MPLFKLIAIPVIFGTVGVIIIKPWFHHAYNIRLNSIDNIIFIMTQNYINNFPSYILPMLPQNPPKRDFII